MRILTIILMLVLNWQVAIAEDIKPEEMPIGEYILDRAHTSVVWKVSHLGLSNYTARFTYIEGKLDWNSKKPEESKVLITIKPNSVKTDYPYKKKKDFDAALAYSKDWFNAKKYTDIIFESKKVEITGDNTGKVTGDLTMLGTTNEVTLDVIFNGAMLKNPFSGKAMLGFSAKGSLKRSDWGMTNYIPNIGDEVEFLIETEFSKHWEEVNATN